MCVRHSRTLGTPGSWTGASVAGQSCAGDNGVLGTEVVQGRGGDVASGAVGERERVADSGVGNVVIGIPRRGELVWVCITGHRCKECHITIVSVKVLQWALIEERNDVYVGNNVTR